MIFSALLGLTLLAAPPAPASSAELDCAWVAVAVPDAECTLESGWSFIREGQQSGDPGLFHFALATANTLQPEPLLHTEATLLKGHALQQLHEFAAAQAVAEALLEDTEVALGYQLLGDIQLERGNLAGAAHSYQQLIDAKPSPAAYARGAQARYYSGDVGGALELVALALEGAARSPARSERAWIERLAGRYLLTAGRADDAQKVLEASLQTQAAAGTELLLAQAQWAAGDTPLAGQTLRRLLERYPAPEAMALLVELGDALPAEWLRAGRQIDARGYARYLLVSGGSAEAAAVLLGQELAQRRDPQTLALAAWAYLDGGDSTTALALVQEAIAAGYPEPLPYLIGARAAEQSRNFELKEHFLSSVSRQVFLLSPLERRHYRQLAAPAPSRS